MAKKYVWNAAGGSQTGDDFTNAYLDIPTALTNTTNGDIILIAKDHTESYAANTTFTFPSADLPKTLMTVDRTTEDFAVATVDTVDVSGGNYDLILNGAFVLKGLQLHIGDDFNSLSDANEGGGLLEDCFIHLENSGSTWKVTGTSIHNEIKNCTIRKDSGNIEPLEFSALVDIDNLKTSGITSVWNALMRIGGSTTTLRNSDLSFLGSGQEIVYGTMNGNLFVLNCKLPTTFSGLVSPLLNGLAGRAVMHGCDDDTGNDITRTEEAQNTLGFASQDASVYRSGGAEPNGQSISWKIDISTAAHFGGPFNGPWMTGLIKHSSYPKTFNFDCFITCDTTLYTEDVWLEVEYYDDDSTVLKTVATSRPSFDTWKDIQVESAAQTELTSSSESWTGEKTNQYRLRVAAAIDRDGPWRARLCFSKPSVSGIYMDPLLRISEA